jgi:hypothetical protein
MPERVADQQLSIKGILVGTTSSGISDQQPSINGILVGTTSSGILDQQHSIKGILAGTTSSGESTTLYEVNPGRNHKFWHIGSTSYQDSLDKRLLIRYARTCGSYQDSLHRGLLIRYARTCGSCQD